MAVCGGTYGAVRVHPAARRRAALREWLFGRGTAVVGGSHQTVGARPRHLCLFRQRRQGARAVRREKANRVAPSARGAVCHCHRPAIALAVERRWIIAPLPEDGNGGIPWTELCGLPCIANLLKRKGFGCAEDVQAFLWPRLGSLGDPFLLPAMDQAIARILTALDARERIVLFGDYDVDGVTSLA